MEQEGKNEALLRKYLLGELNEADEQAFEEQLLADDELSELLLAEEDELVDDYLGGELSDGERKRFDSHFMVTPERERKLKFGDALKSYKPQVVPTPVSEDSGQDPAAEEGAKGTTPKDPGTRESAPDLPPTLVKPPSPVIIGPLSWWKQPSTQYLKMAAAAVIVLAVGLGSWRAYEYFRPPQASKGIASLREAYRDQRPTEARITEFNYAPPPPTTRGPGRDKFDYVALDRAKALIQLEASEHPSAQSYHDLGRLYLAEGDFDKAINQFEKALNLDEKDAQLHSDYGAALLEVGRDYKLNNEGARSFDSFSKALERLNKAMELDHLLIEALFNRALLYEQMDLPQQAEDDWKKYLDAERRPESKWAGEARSHLLELEKQKKTRSQGPAEFLHDFIVAWQSRSDDTAYELMSKNTEAIADRLLWWQVLGAYLDLPSKQGDRAGDQYLQALSYAGRLHQERNGDRFILELAPFYQSSTRERLVALAQAHGLVNQAHALLAKSETDKAMELYKRAKDIFDRTGNEQEAFFVGYWVSYSQYRKSDFKNSLAGFLRLAAQSRTRGYLWLLSNALTMIANIQAESNQFSLSLATYRESLEISKRIEDEYNLQKNLTSLAYNFKNLGDQVESLSYLQQGLERTASRWPGARQMYRNFDTAAGIFNAFGYYTAAAEYQKAALQYGVEAGDPVFEHRCYTHLGAIYAELRNHAEALRYADLSYQVAKTILDERADPRSLALSSLQLAHIYRQGGEYEKAASYYDDSIELYNEINLYTLLYEAHKGRLLCYIGQGDDERAEKELQIVLAFFEEHRAKIREEKNRNSFFDREQYVYDIAIDFEYSRKHDSQKAFEYSETSRARSLLAMMRSGAEAGVPATLNSESNLDSRLSMLGDIREGMSERVQILQYAVLNDKLLIWFISKARFEVAEKPISAQSLTTEVLDYWQAISSASENDTEETRRKGTALYDVLIKPVESLLKRDQQVCIVPDKALNYLPFNALVSRSNGNYLVKDFVLSFAPSANTFLECSAAATRMAGGREERVLSVGDPNFNRGAFSGLSDLTAAGREAHAVALCYKFHCCLVRDNATKQRIKSEMRAADVVHLASHYVIDEQNPMLSKLLLTSRAGDQSSDGVLQGNEISRKDLSVTRLVALSACQTGVERYYKGEGMIGMSRTFLAAGVPLVAASLWPVASNATADLMVRFHKHRRSSERPTSAAALRQAQLDLINNPEGTYTGPYYWASFILIGGYASF